MNGKQRLSASVDADLIEAAEDAVASGRTGSVSAWVNEALRAKCDQDRRLEALDAFVRAYEREHGEIAADEMELAVRRWRLGDAGAWSAGGKGAGGASASEGAVSLVLDAGALIAVERADRDTIALIKHELQAGRVPVTHGGVVGQVWRGGSGRQAASRGCCPHSTSPPGLRHWGDALVRCLVERGDGRHRRRLWYCSPWTVTL